MNKFERILAGIVLCLLACCIFVFTMPYLSISVQPVSAAAVTIESRVKALEVSLGEMKKANDVLTNRVSVIETSVATKTIVLVATPVPTAKVIGPTQATPTPTSDTTTPDYEIVSIKDKITDSNTAFDTRAWIMVIKNNSDKQLIIEATVQFEDIDGFVVSEDFQPNLYIGPRETKTFTGVKIVKLQPSSTIDSVAVHTKVTASQ